LLAQPDVPTTVLDFVSRFYPVPNDATLAAKTPLNKTPSKKGKYLQGTNKQTNKQTKRTQESYTFLLI
jgi:hypothetical protein